MDVTTPNEQLGGFSKLRLNWKRSVYKPIYKKVILYLLIYVIIALIYHIWLHDDYKLQFKNFCLNIQDNTNRFPVNFVLGLYITVVVQPWWSPNKEMRTPNHIKQIVKFVPFVVYFYLVAKLFSQQYLNVPTAGGLPLHVVNICVGGLFTIGEFILYMRSLKVIEQLINPLTDDVANPVIATCELPLSISATPDVATDTGVTSHHSEGDDVSRGGQVTSDHSNRNDVTDDDVSLSSGTNEEDELLAGFRKREENGENSPISRKRFVEEAGEILKPGYSRKGSLEEPTKSDANQSCVVEMTPTDNFPKPFAVRKVRSETAITCLDDVTSFAETSNPGVGVHVYTRSSLTLDEVGLNGEIKKELFVGKPPAPGISIPGGPKSSGSEVFLVLPLRGNGSGETSSSAGQQRALSKAAPQTKARSDANIPPKALNQASLAQKALNESQFAEKALNKTTIPMKVLNESSIPPKALNESNIPLKALYVAQKAKLAAQTLNEPTIPSKALNKSNIPLNTSNESNIPLKNESTISPKAPNKSPVTLQGSNEDPCRSKTPTNFEEGKKLRRIYPAYDWPD